jgi:hypothetical protein
LVPDIPFITQRGLESIEQLREEAESSEHRARYARVGFQIKDLVCALRLVQATGFEDEVEADYLTNCMRYLGEEMAALTAEVTGT